MARRHLLGARQIVDRQRALIKRSKASGFDTTQSEALLRTFEQSLATFEDDLAAIIAETK